MSEIDKLLKAQELLHRQHGPIERLLETQELFHRYPKPIDRLLEAEELLRRQPELIGSLPTDTGSLLEAAHSIEQSFKDLERSQELVRTAFGPLEDLRRIDLELASTAMLGDEIQKTLDTFKNIENQFRLPQITETTALLRELESSTAAIARGISQSRERELEIQSAMEAMRTPWLDIENSIQSITGFVQLQDLGHTLQTIPAFDMALADRLRPALGDWRDPIDWPEAIFSDPLARADFYTARGLDPTLTSFPAAAFDESVTIAGLKEPISDPGEINDFGHEAQVDEEEAGFVRTNAAHNRLQRFESTVRKFIDRQMQAVFGEDWIKHQVSGQIRQAWIDKQQKARDNGEPERPLIDYADFTDYVPIITREDNWQAVFRPVFNRKELVRESFQRLYPARNCVMHARIIIQDEELYLYVETKRLLKAIKAG